MRRRGLAAVTGLLTLAVSVGAGPASSISSASTADPSAEQGLALSLPRLTGRRPVGVTSLHLTDTSRSDTWVPSACTPPPTSTTAAPTPSATPVPVSWTPPTAPIVHGTVTTEAWTDKQTGEKRTAQRVLADIVGPSLRWATARIIKTTRSAAADEAQHDVGELET